MSDEPGDGEWGAIPDELEERIEASRDAEWEARIAKADATPPPDAQAMTRGLAIRIFTDCFNGPREIDPEWSREVDKVARASQVLKDAFDRHDAAQRETIRRLEEEIQAKSKALNAFEVTLNETIAKLEESQARLTASEARVKQQDDVLAYLLDCGPEIVQAVQEAKSDVSEDYGEEQRQERDTLREQVRLLQQAKKWTTARPTVAGWYFWRLVKGRERIVEVSMLNGILYVPVEGGEWQGPLTPGEE